jgi:hypothetical protein
MNFSMAAKILDKSSVFPRFEKDAGMYLSESKSIARGLGRSYGDQAINHNHLTDT